MRTMILLMAAIVLLSLSGLVQADVTNMGAGLTSLDLVKVRNAGNAADTNGYGSVSYVYKIGKYEVTAAQYCEFLNAKAGLDQAIHDGGLGLWPQARWTEVTVIPTGAQIVRTWNGSRWDFTVAADMANRPMNNVSYWNALRFANWLHNGQGNGDTEDGAYTIPGLYTGGDGSSIVRNTDAKWAVTSENEWYKAAYYDPNKPETNESAAGYYRFPTMSDWTPANGTAEVPIIDGFIDPGNYANHGRDWPTTWIPFGNPYRTIVGEFENSASYYGTFDQAANVREWTESVINTTNRVFRGGSRPPGDQTTMASNQRQYGLPSEIDWGNGFRVSYLVQSPPPPTDVTNMGPGLTSLDLVDVVDSGNPADSTGYGSVGYEYKIGKYEVTAAQYCVFLNAKAKTDKNPWNGGMGLWPDGESTRVSETSQGAQIFRTGGGTVGNPYEYEVTPGMENRPVNNIIFTNTLRFANWLHNGQGNGDTETGAYTITSGGITNNTIVRNTGAKWALTSENEWYKAAYYNPNKQATSESIAGYYCFPTMSDWSPDNGTADHPIIDGFDDPGNHANHGRDASPWIPFGAPYRTIVGTFDNSFSYYSTYDQAGNMEEWTESVIDTTNRVVRGGSIAYSDASRMQASHRFAASPAPTSVSWANGFRVSYLVRPEPPIPPDVTNMGPGLTSLDLVTVSDAGNPADSVLGYGSVDYDYKIGKYEVTAAQYCVFLNAKAKIAKPGTNEDLYNLFALQWGTSGDPMMQYSPGACKIERTGGGTVQNPYVYTVGADWANRPVNYVSFMSAARFVNWIHNGQGNGDTENGAYTITADGIANNTITRNTDWTWALPSENEWYKAAYYDPGKTTATYSLIPPYELIIPIGYWQFPTGTNEDPFNLFIEDNMLDPGNYAMFDFAIPTYGRTIVGEFENSPGYYGTFDQGGNVWEMNETIIGANRGMRGSGYSTSDVDAMARFGGRIGNTPNYASSPGVGFRVIKKADAVNPSLSGTVNLLNFGGDKTTVPVIVNLNGTDYPLNLDVDGKFTITDLADGTYDVYIKASHWLARMSSGVIVAGATIMDPVSLINGDVVDNNEVDFSDINATRAAYGSFPGDETWNERADVDGSLEVDFTDINIVRANYGEIGD